MGGCVGVSVGDGVSVGRGVEVSVIVGMGVKVRVEGMFVDVATGAGESEAGVPPVLPGLQADVVHITIRMSRNFEIFIGLIVPKSRLNSSPRPEGGRSG